MFPGWLLIAVSLCYIAILFLIAWRGDRHARRHGPANRRPVIYSLALAIYFTSWTYYGAVGQAATRSLVTLRTKLEPDNPSLQA